ncbi:MAG: hypothetical protein JWO06_336, partial [Bacteroidota bacterium]|nr:hypothetical protein [Bacteroidota bacterium]
MKIVMLSTFAVEVAMVLILNLASCDKDKGTPPNIAFINT